MPTSSTSPFSTSPSWKRPGLGGPAAWVGLLALTPTLIAAAPAAPRWSEPPVSPEVQAAMRAADGGAPAELLALADAGRTDAEFYAGVMLIYGRGGIARDGGKGCAYVQKASASRADAMHLVGVCSQNGLAGAPDKAKAEAAYLKATEMGFVKSRCALGAMLMAEPGQGERGLELCKQSADEGEVDAQLAVADAYFHGKGVKADQKAARLWYGKAAEKKNPQAMRRLGEMYAAGNGGPKDTKKAVVLWQDAEKAGDPMACILVADQLFSDVTGGKKPTGGTYGFKGGVPVADLEAIEAWYQEALNRDPRPDVKKRAQLAIEVVRNLVTGAKSVSVKK